MDIAKIALAVIRPFETGRCTDLGRPQNSVRDFMLLQERHELLVGKIAV